MLLALLLGPVFVVAEVWPQDHAPVALEPRHWIATHQAADNALIAGRFEEAEAGFQALLELDPGNPIATYGVAAVRARRGDLDGAFEWLASAVITRFTGTYSDATTRFDTTGARLAQLADGGVVFLDAATGATLGVSERIPDFLGLNKVRRHAG